MFDKKPEAARIAKPFLEGDKVQNSETGEVFTFLYYDSGAQLSKVMDRDSSIRYIPTNKLVYLGRFHGNK